MAPSPFSGFPRPIVAAVPSLLLAACLVLLLAGAGCNPPPASTSLSLPSKHDLTTEYTAAPFTREQFEADWRVTSGTWTVKDGRLRGKQLARDLADEKEFPVALVWLDKPLPHEFRISFKVQGLHDPRDLNVLFCGDGVDFSGYDLVFGGWDNTKHQLSWFQAAHQFGSRDDLDKVKPGSLRPKEYEVEIERTATSGIKVWLDQDLVMSDRDDPKIADDDSRYLAFYTWDNEAEYWDLEIGPVLPAAPPSTP